MKTLTERQIYSLVKKLKEKKVSDNRKLKVVKDTNYHRKIFLQEENSEGFLVDRDYWGMLKHAYSEAGYQIKKEIEGKKLLGNIFWGGVSLSLIATLGFFIFKENATEKLREQAYKIADTNHDGLDYDELYNLGRGLELIAKNEAISEDEIKNKIDDIMRFGKGYEKFKKYIRENSN